jgi:hypothetical protein
MLGNIHPNMVGICPGTSCPKPFAILWNRAAQPVTGERMGSPALSTGNQGRSLRSVS